MIAIKDMEMPKDCKKCPLMGTDGNPKDLFSPMMCIAIWATTHEIKHCVGGRVRDDCPLAEIVTCKDCSIKQYDKSESEECGEEKYFCPKIAKYVDETPNFYCADGERRE